MGPSLQPTRSYHQKISTHTQDIGTVLEAESLSSFFLSQSLTSLSLSISQVSLISRILAMAPAQLILRNLPPCHASMFPDH